MENIDYNLLKYILTENFIKILALYAMLLIPIQILQYFIFNKINKN